MGATEFDAAFERLMGFAPFRWQCRLYQNHFATGDIPPALDLPTGLGKTSVLAIWLIAIARQATVRRVRLPRRLVYVVDRRAVVDQASAVANDLAERAPGVLGLPELAVSTLRGQHADNGRWLEDPTAPAIVVGTVDMIGSRLLFEGYGVSRRMRPNQAGLLGADTLLVLDEAHLCPPFEALLRSVEADDTLKPDPAVRGVVPPFRLMSLSATGRSSGDKAFRLTDEDRAEDRVAERLRAAKRLLLADLPPDRRLDEELAERARALARGPVRVLVFCHSREVATKVVDRLRKGWPRGKAPPVEALVGARRVRERQKLAGRLAELGFLAGSAPRPEGPAFLVATSAGEVGIDLDADHMVCDLVAAERMIQRLGRVNRRGGAGRTALVEVVAAPFEKEKPEAAAARLAVLKAPLAALPRDPADGRHDASPAALAELKARAPKLLADATTPAPLHPALTRAVVDAWSLTGLAAHPGRPDPGPWLRGWEAEDRPQTTVLWRRWLPWRQNGQGRVRERQPDPQEVEAFFEAARLHLTEILEAGTDEVVDVLLARAKAATALPDDAPAALVLSPAREFRTALTVGDLRGAERRRLEPQIRGGILVLSAHLGGLSADGLLDGKADGLPMPAADDAAAPEPAAPPWPGGLDAGWPAESDPEATGVETASLRILGPGEAVPAGGDWRLVHRFRWSDPEAEEPEWLTVIALRRPGAGQPGDLAVQRTPQLLDDHHDWTRQEAARIATALNLPEAYRAMLEAAAARHDAGKARPAWQRAMAAPADGIYAKTRGGGTPNLLRIHGETYRHEFGSLSDVEANPDALAHLELALRELALHLIAAHHGHARPVIAAVDPARPPSANRACAQAAALRFARLQRRWGPWGLAWWEALLRAADRLASRRLDDESREGR